MGKVMVTKDDLKKELKQLKKEIVHELDIKLEVQREDFLGMTNDRFADHDRRITQLEQHAAA